MENTKMENAVQELANIQNQCQELIERIREIEKEIEQNEPKFERAKKGENYFMVGFADGKARADTSYEDYDDVDDNRFNHNNYFKTPERAQEVADKINFLSSSSKKPPPLCAGIGGGSMSLICLYPNLLMLSLTAQFVIGVLNTLDSVSMMTIGDIGIIEC